jgi:hypothetical protein
MVRGNMPVNSQAGIAGAKAPACKNGAFSAACLDVTEEVCMAYGSAACKTAISIEFVAKPNEAHRVHALVPAAITATLDGVEGFAGCAVMASSQEERLVTVLTFWHGDLTAKAAGVNSSWVCKILDRYMDHRLRVQTMRTQLAIASPRQTDGERDEQRVPVA